MPPAPPQPNRKKAWAHHEVFVFAATVAAASFSFAQQTEPPPEPKPQVVFSGQPQSPAPASADHPATITDADRTAIAITAWDLDVHLNARQQSMEAQARVTLRNSSAAPLDKIALQLSSTLNFDMIGLRGKKIAFRQNTLPSDADHTGQLHEAVIPLDQPLAPQPPSPSTSITEARSPSPRSASPPSARPTQPRRLPTGTASPKTSPASADSATSSGIPSVPCPSRWATAQSSSPKSAARSCSIRTPPPACASPRSFSPSRPTRRSSTATTSTWTSPRRCPPLLFPESSPHRVPATRLGFETPSLFLARRAETYGNGLRVLALDADAGQRADLYRRRQTRRAAGAHLARQPKRFLHHPRSARTRRRPCRNRRPARDPALHRRCAPSHAGRRARAGARRFRLAARMAQRRRRRLPRHAVDRSEPRPHRSDRKSQRRPPRSHPGRTRHSWRRAPGEDLLHATSPAFYRTKAMYVLWMLRDIAGDKALQSALQAYNPAQDTKPDYFEHLLEKPSGKDLRWFFDDWVYRDRRPARSLHRRASIPAAKPIRHVLVAIEIVNDGYAEAEVPVTVKGVDSSVTQRVRVPAHGRITHRITFSGKSHRSGSERRHRARGRGQHPSQDLLSAQ